MKDRRYNQHYKRLDYSTYPSGYGPAGQSWLGDPNRHATELWAIHIKPV